jgi:hypothetical protein
MNSRQIGILSAIALLALPLVGRASVPLVTKTFASSSLAGSSAPFSPGSSKICSVLFTSSGDATVTIRGAADSRNGVYTTNTSFGTNGTIANPGY